MARLTLVRPGGVLDLVTICVVGFVTVLLSILAPGSLPLVLLAFFVIFFAPGYAAAALLFPGRDARVGGDEGDSNMGLLERIAASIMLSTLFFSIGGLLFAWSPWGLTKLTILMEVLALTIGLSALAIWRRSSLAPGEGFFVSFELNLGGGRLNRAEKAILVLAVGGLVFAGALAAYSILGNEDAKEPFTELFITGPDGTLATLPQQMVHGSDGAVQVHVKNQMGGPINYTLTIGLAINGSFVHTSPLDWQVLHNLTLGEGYQVQFEVAKGGEYVGDFRFELPDQGRQQVFLSLVFEGQQRDVWLWVTVT